MFSVKHCIVLACTIALVVAFLLLTKGWDLKKKIGRLWYSDSFPKR